MRRRRRLFRSDKSRFAPKVPFEAARLAKRIDLELTVYERAAHEAAICKRYAGEIAAPELHADKRRAVKQRPVPTATLKGAVDENTLKSTAVKVNLNDFAETKDTILPFIWEVLFSLVTFALVH